jgi:hypothetical protein
MAATLGQVRNALASALEDAYPGWNVYRLPPETVEVPAFVITGFSVVPQAAARVDMAEAEVNVLVSHRHVDQIELLDEVLSPGADGSVWSCVESDPSLGGVVSSTVVTDAGNYQATTVADVAYYAAAFSVQVML